MQWHLMRWHRYVPLRNALKLLSHRQWFFLFGLLLTTDWLLDSQPASFWLPHSVHGPVELERANSTPVTINSLLRIQGISVERHKSPAEKKTVEEVENTGQWLYFTYEKAICKRSLLVSGHRNHFRICYPPKWQWRMVETFSPVIKCFTSLQIEAAFPGNLVYFINGLRDIAFEWNVKKTMHSKNKLFVFSPDVEVQNSSSSTTNDPFSADLAKKIEVKIYATNESQTIGIKDLLDLHGDYHRIELIKFEMQNRIDPLVFSVNIPVFSAHLLLRLEKFTYEEFQQLLRRLANSLYLPYSVVQNESFPGVHFVSFVHKHSMYKYAFSGIVNAKWTPAEHEFH